MLVCVAKFDASKKHKRLFKIFIFHAVLVPNRIVEFKIPVNFNKRDFKISGGCFVEIQKI